MHFTDPINPLTEFIQRKLHTRTIRIQQQTYHRAPRVLYRFLQFGCQFIGNGFFAICDKQNIGVFKRFLVYQSQRFPNRRLKISTAVKKVFSCEQQIFGCILPRQK